MPLTVTCPGCSKQLRVPDNAAGRNVRCPDCQMQFPVAAPPPARNQAAQPAGTNAPAARWFVHSHDGSQYGPVDKSELDGWVNEGLLTPACQLQAEGGNQWQPAATIYPQLQQAPSTHTAMEQPPPKPRGGVISPFNPVSSAKTIDSYVQHMQYESKHHPDRVRKGVKQFMAIWLIALAALLLFGMCMVGYALFIVFNVAKDF